MAYITRYWKARQSTNREFHVVRYLPREDSHLLVTYLAYVRPFTDMLYRICYSDARRRRLLFALSNNDGQMWKAGVLIRALRQLTQRVCGVQFGVQIYR